MTRPLLTICMVLALALAAPLSACGKKGDPEAPAGKPNNYPKIYPAE